MDDGRNFAAMIRVAYVIWSLGLGGAEQVVIRLAAGLDRKRFQPLIICLNDEGLFAAQAQAAGVEVIALHKGGPADLKVLIRLMRWMRSRRIDVVHTHLWGANLWGRLAARLAGVETIIATEHNVDTWKRWYHLSLDRILADWTTQLVAVSQAVREFYESRGVGVGRWQVICNGVAEGSGHPRERGPAYRSLGIVDGEPVVGLIGRLVPAKAPEVFVEAVARAARALPSMRALIIGDGPLRGQIEAQVRRAGLEKTVIITGVRDDVPDLLAGMDALVFSSEREGLSMAMLEAMAAGVPVIATEVGGTPELIDSPSAGMLVPPRQPDALAEALVDLLSHPVKAQTIREAARRRVEQTFTLQRLIADHEALYQTLRRRR